MDESCAAHVACMKELDGRNKTDRDQFLLDKLRCLMKGLSPMQRVRMTYTIGNKVHDLIGLLKPRLFFCSAGVRC